MLLCSIISAWFSDPSVRSFCMEGCEQCVLVVCWSDYLSACLANLPASSHVLSVRLVAMQQYRTPCMQAVVGNALLVLVHSICLCSSLVLRSRKHSLEFTCIHTRLLLPCIMCSALACVV